ncbi:MAG: CDP-archaeol synthase [Patescibacteria group bacterium]|nr:CDP-archaeol synthase [Patescibacteria group bacterium]
MIYIYKIIWIFLPSAFANMAPLFSLKINFLNFPITKNLFGENKTWRGLFFGIMSGILVAFLQKTLSALFYKIEIINYKEINILVFGFLMGFGALMGDLLESFIKRRLKIFPGKSLPIFDQIDWIIGSLIILSFYIKIQIKFVLYSILILGILHFLINTLSYNLKIRKTVL